MELVVNGEACRVALEDGEWLAEVLKSLELKADRVAVERNGEIVGRAAWGSTPVHGGDRLEVVHFVGGGV